MKTSLKKNILSKIKMCVRCSKLTLALNYFLFKITCDLSAIIFPFSSKNNS